MPKEGRQTYNARATHTRATVRLYHDDFKKAIEFRAGVDTEFGSLVGVSTSKTLGAPSGQWQIQVKQTRRSEQGSLTSLIGVGPTGGSLLRNIRDPEAMWVKIFFEVDGKTFETMWGICDTAAENTTRNDDGAATTMYTFSGRDVGKVFENTSLFINIFDASTALTSYVAIKNAMAEKWEGAPGEIVEGLVRLWLFNGSATNKPWKLPKAMGKTYFSDYLDMDNIEAKDLESGHGVFSSLLNPSLTGSSLWGMMQQYSNPLLNELWVDLNTPEQLLTPSIFGAGSVLPETGTVRRPVLHLRERPFPTRKGGRIAWEGLPTHRLARSDLRGRQVAKGSASMRFNYWFLRIGGLDGGSFDVQAFLTSGRADAVEAGKPGTAPIVNADSVSRHGLRKWEQGTLYNPIGWTDQTDDVVKQQTRLSYKTAQDASNVAANWLRKCHDWHAVAPLELTGTLMCSRIQPEIQVGHRVREERDGEPDIVYYVEGVSHQWAYPQASSTTVTVTRGEYVDEELLDVVYEAYDGFGLEIPEVPELPDAAGAVAGSVAGAIASAANFGKLPVVPTLEQIQARRQALGDLTAAVVPDTPSTPEEALATNGDLPTGLP